MHPLAEAAMFNEAQRDPRRGKPAVRKPSVVRPVPEPWQARRKQYLEEVGRVEKAIAKALGS